MLNLHWELIINFITSISLKKVIKQRSCDLGNINIIFSLLLSWASPGSSSKFVICMEVEISFQI